MAAGVAPGDGQRLRKNFPGAGVAAIKGLAQGMKIDGWQGDWLIHEDGNVILSRLCRWHFGPLQVKSQISHSRCCPEILSAISADLRHNLWS